MKNRMNVVVMTLLVILAVLVVIVVKQRNAGKAIAIAAPATETQTIPKLQVILVPAPEPIAVVRRHATDEPARIGDDDTARHIAQPGETVTSLATDLLGKDTKTNRDAIVNANASLQADPDKLVAGKSYRIPAAPEVSHAQAAPTVPAPATPEAPHVEAAPVVQAPPAPKPQAEVRETTPAKPAPELKYTAAAGDTVAKMAQAFLGSDQKTHQDAIVNANPSLQADPDRVLIGKTYKIPAPDGLSTSATPAPVTTPRAATQPDADQVVLASSTRTLRYTALPGDSVTTLAIKLLGSDTQDARDLIISNNPSLKKDPDRVIAGQTYWIPAPVAATRNP